jgi:hypothetical protein
MVRGGGLDLSDLSDQSDQSDQQATQKRTPPKRGQFAPVA